MKNHNISIGLFGGLFDPPHIGHLILGQWVLEEFNLDRMVFIPAFKPPHKYIYSPFKHRFEMIRIGIKENKKFLVTDIERHIKDKTYTVEVIKKIKHYYKNLINSQFYLIIGADQWNEIRYWKSPEIIFDEVKVIVIPRPNFKIKKIKPFYEKVLISNAPLMNISSTMIRERVKKGLSIEYLVLPGILEYIKKHKLYTH